MIPEIYQLPRIALTFDFHYRVYPSQIGSTLLVLANRQESPRVFVLHLALQIARIDQVHLDFQIHLCPFYLSPCLLSLVIL